MVKATGQLKVFAAAEVETILPIVRVRSVEASPPGVTPLTVTAPVPKKFSELAVKSAGMESTSAVAFVKQRSSTGESTVRPQLAGSLMVSPSPPPVQKQYSVWRRMLTQSTAVA